MVKTATSEVAEALRTIETILRTRYTSYSQDTEVVDTIDAWWTEKGQALLDALEDQERESK